MNHYQIDMAAVVDEIRKEPGEIKELTGLRGLAALGVVVAHFAQGTAPIPSALPQQAMVVTGTLGILSMTVFFTLSGYVIAMNYWGWDWRANPTKSVTRFLGYRIARLYPVYFLFIIIVLMRIYNLHFPFAPGVGRMILATLLLAQSWLPVKFNGDFVGADAFNVSWSVSTEFGLYVFFVLSALIVSRLPARKYSEPTLFALFFAGWLGLLALLWTHGTAIVPSWNYNEWSSWLFYASPFGMVVDFAVGVLAWRLTPRLASKDRPSPGNYGASLYLLVFVVSAVLLGLSSSGQGTEPWDRYAPMCYFAASLAIALIMIGTRTGDSLVNRLLRSRPIVYCGKISYSLYLFHFVSASIAHADARVVDPVTMVYYLLNFTVGVLVALAIATGLYQLVEVPARKYIRGQVDRLLGHSSAHVQVVEAAVTS